MGARRVWNDLCARVEWGGGNYTPRCVNAKGEEYIGEGRAARRE